MSGPLSVDLRERVVSAWERGEGTQTEIAARFGVVKHDGSQGGAVDRSVPGDDALPESMGDEFVEIAAGLKTPVDEFVGVDHRRTGFGPNSGHFGLAARDAAGEPDDQPAHPALPSGRRPS